MGKAKRRDKPFDLSDPRERRAAERALAWGDHGFLRVWFWNMHRISGEMWRSNQPSPRRLETLAARGFRTILNLRGPQPGRGYYDLEHEAGRRLGLEVVDLSWGSREAPFVERIEHLIEVFDRIAYPALMHCKSGADRAGIVAVLYRLLHEGAPFKVAIKQLSWRYGHVKQGKTGMLDHFFALYAERTAREPIDFLTWLRTEYNRQACHDTFMASWWGSVLSEKVLRRE